MAFGIYFKLWVRHLFRTVWSNYKNFLPLLSTFIYRHICLRTRNNLPYTKKDLYSCFMWRRIFIRVLCEKGTLFLFYVKKDLYSCFYVKKDLYCCFMWRRNFILVLCEEGSLFLFYVKKDIYPCFIWGMIFILVLCEEGSLFLFLCEEGSLLLFYVKKDFYSCFMWRRIFIGASLGFRFISSSACAKTCLSASRGIIKGFTFSMDNTLICIYK